MSDERLKRAFRSLAAPNDADDWRAPFAAMTRTANERTEMYVQAIKERDAALAERDALAAEVARLREAATRLCHWSAQAVDLLSTVKPLEEPAVIGWVMRETTAAVSAARALVEAPR